MLAARCEGHKHGDAEVPLRPVGALSSQGPSLSFRVSLEATMQRICIAVSASRSSRA